MSDPPKVGAIAEISASREGSILARSILGTDDPRQISENFDAFCAARLGSAIGETFFCELSVGAAFGLRLRDGRRIMLKAHPPDRTPRFLGAVYRVQRYLYEREFPCPEPIAGPLPFGHGFATVEEFVDEGEFADAHDPRIRRSMSRALAWTVELTPGVPDVEGLSQGWTWPENRLWPQPHNALFDFDATAEGAGWIDAFAREAKRKGPRSIGRIVAGHTDWSVKHFRFTGDEVRVIYDWDSLRLDKEPVIVGTAAATFPATWYLEVPSRAPSPDEMQAFIEEYEAACGTSFSRREREAVVSAAAYVIAYSARCEHAVDPEGKDLRGSFREALSSYGEEYLHV